MVDNVLEHQHVAVGIFLLSEQGERDLPRGVVHSADQGQVWASALQPVVAAPIDLQQHPLLGIALPSAVAFGGSAATWTPQSSGQQDPPHGRVGQMDILSLCQHLGQMGVVESCIGPLGQLHHLLLCPRVGGGHRLPSSVPVSYGSISLLSICCQ